ncbi:hypothetical protein [Arthrobacter sp. ISL-72]|uniref:hypothetical protein n=1 Tax=Arthrobacter sp. ISL-72 TaxID=2819114 RepID=UPI001BEAF12C|nr:hypothetical protein [Arthrobacter sp. ISL-72]MBT2594139.1 hypothetical protein [Arthrobacter sp. ISL-72]
MPFEEKSAWIMGGLAVVSYAVYLAIVLGLSGSMPLTEVPYTGPLPWTVGGSIVASILLHIVVRAFSADDAGRKDQRDREIYRFGEYVGQSFLVIGGVSALVMAMAEVEHFWIANAIYLSFFLSAILGSVAKIIAYRRGFQPW